MAKNGLVWMVGGPQGSGVDSAANIFARACCYSGLYVFGNREYHSNIKGMHSYFHVRASEHPVHAHLGVVDLLATFDSETLARHFSEVASGGGVLYDPSLEATKIREIPTLEIEAVNESLDRLKKRNLGGTVADILASVKEDGIRVYPVPFMDLVKQVAERIGESKISRVARVVNVLVLGASFSILDADINLLARAIKSVFGAKASVAEMNVLAAQTAYDYAKKNFPADFGVRLPRIPVKENRIFLMGNQAVALGKLAGGCRFQTYYPITPAADESEYLEAHEQLDLLASEQAPPTGAAEVSTARRSGSILVVQTEDEIAAVNMASGATLAGARASTSTSGPGFSLMAEGLGWAGMNEVPVVITYYQRGAPSTGLPTRHGQDDLRFAIHAGHGEFARIVIASGDIQECYYDAALAFNYAERFQVPVIHLLDKAMANSSDTYPVFETSKIIIERGELLDSEGLQKHIMQRGDYRRFRLTESGISPRVVLGTPGTVIWNTGDERDEFGHISENPTNRTRMMDKRMKKLDLIEREVSVSEKVNTYRTTGPAATVVSWGSTKGSVLEARELLNREGIEVNFLQVRMLHPFPAADLGRLLSGASKIIDIEMNYSGQLASILREKTGITVDHLIVKYNGRPMTSDEVYSALKNAISGKAGKREVLTGGA